MLTRGDILVQFLSFPPQELQCRWADPGTLRELAGIPCQLHVQFAIKVFHDSLIFVIIFFLHLILIYLLHTYLKVPCSKILKLFLIYHLLISKSMEWFQHSISETFYRLPCISLFPHMGSLSAAFIHSLIPKCKMLLLKFLIVYL